MSKFTLPKDAVHSFQHKPEPLSGGSPTELVVSGIVSGFAAGVLAVLGILKLFADKKS